MKKAANRTAIARTDEFLASAGMKRAKNPGGALGRARTVRNDRVEPRRAPKKIKTAVEVVRAPDWAKRFPWLIHGFSTRTGGASSIYGGKDLNLTFTQPDNRGIVERNRRAFVKALGWKKSARGRADQKAELLCMKQVHSDIIHLLNEKGHSGATRLVGDGLITHLPGLLLAIQVADCVPVLLMDAKRKVIGAFHAGWRGTARRIVEKGVGMMRMEYGSDPKHIHAAIGPAIGPCCYAVGDEVVNAFHSQFAYAPALFHEVFDDDPVKKKYPLLFLTARAPGHGDTGPQTHLDLFEANRRQLLDAGLPAKNIWISGLCTSCDTTRFFSHRKEHGFTGRMMGAIGIA